MLRSVFPQKTLSFLWTTVNQGAANRKRRWLVRGAKWLILLAVLWGVAHTVQQAIPGLRQSRWQLHPWWLLLAGALYLVGLLPSAVFWHRVLSALGQRPSWLETFRAYYIGHLGKYVPGKALVVVLRTMLVRGHRVDTPVAAMSVFYETLTMMSVGALVAAAVIAVRFRHHGWLAAVAVLLMFAAGLPTIPAVFAWLVRLMRIERFQPGLAASLRRLDPLSLIAGWAGIALGWAVIGLSLWATLRGLGADARLPEDAPLCIASAALAVVAGFLSMIPGGAVVREAVLLELMAPRFGEAAALSAALMLRVVWLLAELSVSVILYLWPEAGGSA